MLMDCLTIKSQKSDVSGVALAIKNYLNIENEQFAILLNMPIETVEAALEDKLIFKRWLIRRLIIALTELRLVDNENSEYFDELEIKLGDPNISYVAGVIRDGAIEEIINMRKNKEKKEDG